MMAQFRHFIKEENTFVWRTIENHKTKKIYNIRKLCLWEISWTMALNKKPFYVYDFKFVNAFTQYMANILQGHINLTLRSRWVLDYLMFELRD